MKKLFLIMFVFLILLQTAFGQSKIAVLDASLGAGVDINAAAIVADTLNEQFVKSNEFIAIDRAYISSIQQEKKFQLSGDVNQADIKKMGDTFGAEFICIANVSLLGSTYTVSARLIEVETAQVVSQESARKQGQIDVLFNVAEEVGKKLIGKEFADSQSTTAEQVEGKTNPVKKPTTAKQTPAKSGEGKPHFTISYLLAGFMGGENSWATGYSIYETDEYVIHDLNASSTDLTTWGIDIHIMIPIKFLYWSLGVSYTNQALSYEASGWSYFYETFSTVSPAIGVGGIYPVGTNFQIYGGLNLGYLICIAGSDYDDDATESMWTSPGASAGGFAFGLELGADYFLGDFSINARYKLSRTADLTGEEFFTDYYEDNLEGDTSFGVQGLVLGVGYTW